MHDYHLHSHFCRDAAGRLEEYARAAERKGIGEICFTPHIPLPGFRPGFFNDRIRMDVEEFPAYEEELKRTRERFPRLTILSGIEADYIAGREGFLESFLGSHAFDLVLMSVHFIAAWPADQWVFDFTRDPRPLESIYDDYLAAVRAGILSGLFDCVAHLDLIKKPGRPLVATHRHQVVDVIDLCKARGMSAEINTSGSRKQIAECYPAEDISLLLEERGVPLTPGSDAHDPAQVGFGLDRLGDKHLARYRGRRIVECPHLDS